MHLKTASARAIQKRQSNLLISLDIILDKITKKNNSNNNNNKRISSSYTNKKTIENAAIENLLGENY